MARPLFDDVPIGDTVDARRRKLAAAIAELSPEVFLTRGLDEQAAELVDTYRMRPLVLHWDAMTAESHEVEIDVGGDAKRRISDPTGPFKVSGTEITHFVPFSGDDGLFDMRPSRHTKNPPLGFVRRPELLIGYSGVDADPSKFRSEFDRQEADVKVWVAAIKTDVDAFNTDLARQVRAQLKARFKKARADADLVTALGIPLHQHPRTRREDTDAGRRSTAAAAHEPAPDPRLGPGRPGWTPELFKRRWREALMLTPQPQTYASRAEHFRPLDGLEDSVTGDHLRRLRRKWLPD